MVVERQNALEWAGARLLKTLTPLSRAQQRLDTSRRRRAVDAATHRRFVQAFLGAARGGDLEILEWILLR